MVDRLSIGWLFAVSFLIKQRSMSNYFEIYKAYPNSNIYCAFCSNIYFNWPLFYTGGYYKEIGDP